MSQVLYWEPVVKASRTWIGGHPMKGLLLDAFGDEGLVGREQEFELDKTSIDALQMLWRTHHNDEVRGGLSELIEAINHYGCIRITQDE